MSSTLKLVLCDNEGSFFLASLLKPVVGLSMYHVRINLNVDEDGPFLVSVLKPPT